MHSIEHSEFNIEFHININKLKIYNIISVDDTMTSNNVHRPLWLFNHLTKVISKSRLTITFRMNIGQ